MARYSINFAPLTISGETTVLIGRQSYDEAHLRELRREFSHTHVFRRDRNTIIDVPICENSDPLGNIQEEIDLAEDRLLLPSLFGAALLRAFHGQRDIFSDAPVSILGDVSRGMINHPALPS